MTAGTAPSVAASPPKEPGAPLDSWDRRALEGRWVPWDNKDQLERKAGGETRGLGAPRGPKEAEAGLVHLVSLVTLVHPVTREPEDYLELQVLTAATGREDVLEIPGCQV